jgi:hypothetical protein
MCLTCYYFYIVLFLHLYCCYVVYPDHHFTVIYIHDLYTQHNNSTSVKIKQCRSNNKTDTDYTSLKVYLYCCYVVYTDHHFTGISVQTCVVCVCLVITSILFYLYTCTVVMLCIQVITLL